MRSRDLIALHVVGIVDEVPELALEETKVEKDVGERVVELVGDSRGEGSDRRHAIGLNELRLVFAPLADVAHESEKRG